MASTSYHGFDYTGYRSPVYFRTETTLEEGETSHAIDFQQAWQQHRVAWSLEKKVAGKCRHALPRKCFRAWLAHARKKKKKSEEGRMGKGKDIDQLMNRLSAAIGELSESSKELNEPQPAMVVEADTGGAATTGMGGQSTGAPLKTLEYLGTALTLTDIPPAESESVDAPSPPPKRESKTIKTKIGIESEKDEVKETCPPKEEAASTSKEADRNIIRKKEEAPAPSPTSVALGISIDLNGWLLRRRCWYSLCYSFNKWKKRRFLTIEEEESKKKNQQIDIDDDDDDEHSSLDLCTRISSPRQTQPQSLGLQRADTLEVDLLRFQLESLLKDKSNLKEENDHLLKENLNLQEVVSYISASSAAGSPSPLSLWQQEPCSPDTPNTRGHNRVSDFGTPTQSKLLAHDYPGEKAPAGTSPTKPHTHPPYSHAQTISATDACGARDEDGRRNSAECFFSPNASHPKFANAEDFYTSHSPSSTITMDKRKEKKSDVGLDLDKPPRVPKLASAFYHK